MPAALDGFLHAQKDVIEVRIMQVQGSVPRGVDAVMFVTAQEVWGTIGGGQLEFRMIDLAKGMLTTGQKRETHSIPLGPEIGQCCGGRVDLELSHMSAESKMHALQVAQDAKDAAPHIYILGAGHVGRALALQLQHLPVRCILIDPRTEELELCTADVEKRASALPEQDIITAPKGSAFIILTHDHALDFLLTTQALQRGDAAYVGLIGSATKRAQFSKWHQREGTGSKATEQLDALHCPIGRNSNRDKRPSIIAAFVIAEVLEKFGT
jgi:xanthine dehydrogenase accessory factor